MARKPRRNIFFKVSLIVVIVAVVTVPIFFVYQKMGAPFLASYQYTSVSPDKKYRVDVYSAPLFFAMPGGGGAGSHDALIILRNNWGWEIGSNYECEIFMDDVQIEWNSEKYVSVAVARTIDLSTGQCEQ